MWQLLSESHTVYSQLVSTYNQGTVGKVQRQSTKYKVQQQFQMNRYILQGFLKWLFWYILNLYGKLPLLVKKFLQKDQFKGPKIENKNVDFATYLKSPHFLQMNR